jgi:hypothetical protein
MSYSPLLKTPAIRAALAALTIAVVILVWTVVRATRPAPLPRVTPMAIAQLDAGAYRAARPFVDINAAVDNDVFSPDRTPPSGSYRLPGEAGPDDKAVVEVQRPMVLGTAVATDGRNFATVELGDSGPKLVRVGDRIGDWFVRAIERGKVAFVTSSGVRADLGVATTGAVARTEAPNTPEDESVVGPFGRGRARARIRP